MKSTRKRKNTKCKHNWQVQEASHLLFGCSKNCNGDFITHQMGIPLDVHLCTKCAQVKLFAAILTGRGKSLGPLNLNGNSGDIMGVQKSETVELYLDWRNPATEAEIAELNNALRDLGIRCEIFYKAEDDGFSIIFKKIE